MHHSGQAGRYSSVGSDVVWESRGTAIDPRVRHIFDEDLVMKLFLRPFFLFYCFKKSSCQSMVKGCALSTGYLPRGGLPRNSVDRITDRPDMTSAVDPIENKTTAVNPLVLII